MQRYIGLEPSEGKPDGTELKRRTFSLSFAPVVSAARSESTEGLWYAPAPGGYAGRDGDKGKTRAPYKRKGNHLCRFVLWIWWISHLGWNLPLQLASLLLSGMNPPDLGEVMAGNSNRFWLYTSPGQSRDEAILTRAARHTLWIAIYLQALTYHRLILKSLFRHTRGVRSKSSRAPRLKLQHSHSLVARCYNFSRLL